MSERDGALSHGLATPREIPDWMPANVADHASEMLIMLRRVIAETRSPQFQTLYLAYIKQHGRPYQGDNFCLDVMKLIEKVEGDTQSQRT